MLVISVRNGCVACVLLVDGIVKDRRMSIRAFASIETSKQAVRSWIKDYQPDVFVSEDPNTVKRKGTKQRAMLRGIEQIGHEADALNIVVERKRMFSNRYKHAAVLGERFKSVRHLVPKEPPIWMPEPRKMIYFEALAMAAQVIDER